MKNLIRYLKYSGIWAGLVVNPYHWQLGWGDGDGASVYLGPVWLRVIIDNGERW